MAYKDPNDERARESRRKHYRDNKEQYYERNRQKTKAMRTWIQEVKSKPCMDCGVSYPYYVMDFDHRDPSIKTDFIGKVIRRGSWNLLREEVAKCDVVCSNCHRERTLGTLGRA